MKSHWFTIGFIATVAAFIVINVIDYFRERAEYYRFLEDNGWVWAGSWTWGFPFVMFIEGLGTDAEKYSLISPGAILNLIIWLAVAGCVGITMEYLRSKFWPVTS